MLKTARRIHLIEWWDCVVKLVLQRIYPMTIISGAALTVCSANGKAYPHHSLCDCVVQHAYCMLSKRKLRRACKASRASHPITIGMICFTFALRASITLGCTVHFWKC